MIFDIGPETAARFALMMREAGTVVGNGPVGVFEFDQFGAGTRILGEAIASFPNLFPACNQCSLLSQIVVETTGMKRGELIYLYSIPPE